MWCKKSSVEELGEICYQYCCATEQNISSGFCNDKKNCSIRNNHILLVKDVAYYLTKISLSDTEQEYEYVLNKYFNKGFKINSVINNNKFKRFYALEYSGKEVIVNNDFNDIIMKMCINCTDGLFMTPFAAVSDQSLLADILSFVLTSFKEGKTSVYYEGIYHVFSSRLIDTNIYSISILKGLLSYYFEETFCFRKSYMTLSSDVEVSPNEEIEEVLIENDAPMDKDSIIQKLPYISRSKILEILKTNRKIIYLQKNSYWHIDKFDVTENDRVLLDDIIRYEIKEGFISLKKLFEKLKISMADFIENNHIINHVCLGDILRYYFENDFCFKYKCVGKFGEEMSAIVAVSKYIEDRETFTLTEIFQFVEENNLPKHYELFINEALNKFIRINREDFVRKETIKFNIAEVENIVSKYIETGYVLINQIENYSIFPDIGTSWNEYLLENMIDKYSSQYQILSFSRSVTKTIGVIVEQGSIFQNYESVLTDVIHKQKNLLNINHEKTGIEYLYNNGFLAQRRLKNYNEILGMIK